MTAKSHCDGLPLAARRAGQEGSAHLAIARARIGSFVGGWRLVRLVGMGGMASVYAGERRDGAMAALKLLHPEFASRPRVRNRFLSEGYAAGLVQHPGAVKILEEGDDQGTAYLAMELLEGETLEERRCAAGG